MICTLLTWIIATCAVAAPAPAGPIPGPDQILATLQKDHPRLMASREDIDRVRQLIKTDAGARGLRDALKKEAEKILDQPPIVHRLIGPRLLDQSRTCLHRVQTLALMYRLEADERFARRAEKEMLTAAAFPDWNPSHFLDVAEMTNALGLGYDWLYEYLSPESRGTIRQAIVELGLKPSLDIYEKKRWWASVTHNWNQVCNGGMAVGALAIADEEPKLAGSILAYAAKSIRLPTARLKPDGGWDEGPGYWNYAMSYTAYYLAAVRSALGTDFGLSAMPGLSETGLFRIHSVGPIGLVFNYADAGEGAGGAPEMHYFARLFDRPVYAWQQRKFGGRGAAFDLLWYDPRGTDADMQRIPLDAFFTNVNVAFMRSSWDDEAIYVGFKGGDNKANHSHLDLGSFVLDAAGQRWALGMGGDDYNLPAYFGNKRWTYYRLRTEGQNTLLINGANQDPKATAPITAFATTPRRTFAVADLTAAYAPHAQQVHRGMALLDRRMVLIQDEIEAQREQDVEWLLHTRAQAKINGADVEMTLHGKKLHLRAVESAGGSWTFDPVKIEPPQRPATGVNCLVLHFKTKPPSTRTAVAIWAGDLGDPPVASEITPLTTWAIKK